VSPPNKTKILRIPSRLLNASSNGKDFDLLGKCADASLCDARLGNRKQA
jgi:hypothetical protein